MLLLLTEVELDLMCLQFSEVDLNHILLLLQEVDLNHMRLDLDHSSNVPQNGFRPPFSTILMAGYGQRYFSSHIWVRHRNAFSVTVLLAVCLKEGGRRDSETLGIFTNYLEHNVMTRALSGKVLFLRKAFAHAVFPMFKDGLPQTRRLSGIIISPRSTKLDRIGLKPFCCQGPSIQGNDRYNHVVR